MIRLVLSAAFLATVSPASALEMAVFMRRTIVARATSNSVLMASSSSRDPGMIRLLAMTKVAGMAERMSGCVDRGVQGNGGTEWPKAWENDATVTHT